MIEIDAKAKIKELTSEVGLLIAQLHPLDAQRERLVQEIQFRQSVIRYLQSLSQEETEK